MQRRTIRHVSHDSQQNCRTPIEIFNGVSSCGVLTIPIVSTPVKRKKKQVKSEITSFLRNIEHGFFILKIKNIGTSKKFMNYRFESSKMIMENLKSIRRRNMSVSIDSFMNFLNLIRIFYPNFYPTIQETSS